MGTVLGAFSGEAIGPVVAGIAALLSVGCGGGDDYDPEANFLAFADAAMKDEQIPGLAAAIVVGDEIVWERALGYADVEQQSTVTVDTPFALASVSKTLVAATLMKAVEDELVTLDRDVNSLGLPFVIDNPNVDDEQITLRHLATHTSGILDDVGETATGRYACSYYVEADSSPLISLLNPDSSCPDPAVTDLGEYLEAYLVKGGGFYSAEKNFSESAPGEAYSYSNVGCALTALAVQTAAGTSFEELGEQGLFAPLGMNNTHWHRADFAEPSAIARQYTMLDGERIELPDYSLATYPDGGARSSAHDLARFAGAVLNGGVFAGARILSAESVETMTTSQTDAALGSEGIEQGIFWVRQGQYVLHDGRDPGSTTFVLLEPTAGYAVVLLANLDSDSPAWYNLANSLALLGESLAK